MPDERDVFERFVYEKGTHRIEPLVIYAPTHPEGSCWEAAWTEAQRLMDGGFEARYTEGTCWRPEERVRAHAWVEVVGGRVVVDDRIFEIPGFCIVERTEGYGDCVAYQGIQMDATPGGSLDRMTAPWGTERASVFEAMIATQYPELLRGA